MQRIVSAIGRGIASPSANLRRPPSPNRGSPEERRSRSRSPLTKGRKRSSALPSPASSADRGNMERFATEEGEEEVPATPVPDPPKIMIHPDGVTVNGVPA
eukprot:1544538-Pyramimonas_sp.AAC.1